MKSSVSAACLPCSPLRVSGIPTTIRSGSSSAICSSIPPIPAFDRTRSTTATGRASTPVSSLTATPVRARP